MHYHVGLVTKSGEVKGKAFETKSEAEDYILQIAETIGIKLAKLRNLETGQEENIEL